METLKKDYKDDILDTSKNEKRKYNMIQNSDGTVSFEDVTEYTQVGDSFGSKDVNEITNAVDELETKLSHIGMIIQSTTLDTEEKVKAIYGGDKWDRITGRFLIGASEEYDVSSTGGYSSATIVEHTHTTQEHNHVQFSHTHTQKAHEHTTQAHQHNLRDSNAFVCYNYGMVRKGMSKRSIGADAGTSVMVPAINSSDVEFDYRTNVESESVIVNPATAVNEDAQAENRPAKVIINRTGMDGEGMNIPPYKAVYIWERTA